MMQPDKLYNPFVRTADTTQRVMADVIVALVPSVVMAWVAFGTAALSLIAVSVGSALVAEYLFGLVFRQRPWSVLDGSAIVTGLLLALTLGAFTPLHVVAFGAAMAVVFGKLLWGGLGRNLFNPALVGRELMTVYFPAVMTSGAIWYDHAAVNFTHLSWLGDGLWGDLLFKPAGAVGEYSILALVAGGLYLIYRRRITWHIPLALCLTFTVCLSLTWWLAPETEIQFSLGGLLLGAIFMATDMPTSASTPWGKVYYGALIGLTAYLFILWGLKYEYMSFSILLVNGYSRAINWPFRPRVWGMPLDLRARVCRVALITFEVIATAIIVTGAKERGLVHYFVMAFIVWCIARYVYALWRRPGEA